ncbi:MAG: thiamine phosphate synthase [Candidatus Omnitrophica bacterium]|nr:thiamine phosphate synthase [Candidatus Omnitrophota bacterium]
MMSKKDLIKKSRLYVIVDRDSVKGDKIFKISEAAVSGGADMVELRDKSSSTPEIIKTARILKKITKRYDVPLIINDRLDVALAIDADGLHIGRGDIDISLARTLMGRKKLIGVTVKNLKSAHEAKLKGADYLGVGPIFKTPIKPGIKPKGTRLLNAVKRVNMPFFAIGGIDCANIKKLTERGFKRIAVIRALCKARVPYIAALKLKEALF